MAKNDNGPFLRIVRGRGRSPVVLTCDHASDRLPDPWQWSEADHWLAGSHWAFDLGAASLTADLAEALGAAAVLSAFTRLLCDANRSEDDADLFRSTAEGRPVGLNADLTATERERRLSAWHRPYHDAIDAACREHPGEAVLAVHTFTPMYIDQPREVEIGVLFDEEEDVAADWAVTMTDRGLAVWLNEPYSGKEGLIYSATRHGRAHGRRPLELEVRNDLASDAAWRAENVPKIAEALLEALGGRVE